MFTVQVWKANVYTLGYTEIGGSPTIHFSGIMYRVYVGLVLRKILACWWMHMWMTKISLQSSYFIRGHRPNMMDYQETWMQNIYRSLLLPEVRAINYSCLKSIYLKDYGIIIGSEQAQLSFLLLHLKFWKSKNNTWPCLLLSLSLILLVH